MRWEVAARSAAGARAFRDLLNIPTLHAGEQAHRPEGRVFLISRGEAHSDRLASSNTPSQWLLFEVSLGSGGRGISTVPCRARCNLAEIYRDSISKYV